MDNGIILFQRNWTGRYQTNKRLYLVLCLKHSHENEGDGISAAGWVAWFVDLVRKPSAPSWSFALSYLLLGVLTFAVWWKLHLQPVLFPCAPCATGSRPSLFGDLVDPPAGVRYAAHLTREGADDFPGLVLGHLAESLVAKGFGAAAGSPPAPGAVWPWFRPALLVALPRRFRPLHLGRCRHRQRPMVDLPAGTGTHSQEWTRFCSWPCCFSSPTSRKNCSSGDSCCARFGLDLVRCGAPFCFKRFSSVCTTSITACFRRAVGGPNGAISAGTWPGLFFSDWDSASPTCFPVV